MEEKNKPSPKEDAKPTEKEVKVEEEMEESPENLLIEKDEDTPEIKDFRKFIGCGG